MNFCYSYFTEIDVNNAQPDLNLGRFIVARKIPEKCTSFTEKIRALLSTISHRSSHFKGCWRNLHGLEFPFGPKLLFSSCQIMDFPYTDRHEAICYPTILISIYQATGQYPGKNIVFSIANVNKRLQHH